MAGRWAARAHSLIKVRHGQWAQRLGCGSCVRALRECVASEGRQAARVRLCCAWPMRPACRVRLLS